MALLAYAPGGLYVLRVNHVEIKEEVKKTASVQQSVLWITVGTWRRAEGTSLLLVVEKAIRLMYTRINSPLCVALSRQKRVCCHKA